MKSRSEFSYYWLSCLVLFGLMSGCSKQSSSSQELQSESGEPSDGWPQQPIVISCFAAAGGGTDTVSRLVAKSMEVDLGVKVNVVNRAAGRGGAAINFCVVEGTRWLQLGRFFRVHAHGIGFGYYGNNG